MKDYIELLQQIPPEAWQYVEAEYEEDDEGNGSIQFYWDPDEHPELEPLNQLDDEQWNDFVITSLQHSLDNGTFDDDSESSDRNDGEGGELDQESDS
jgi:hypothetical protein